VFLTEPPPSAGLQAAYEDDRRASGYVDNLTRLWCWRPDLLAAFSGLQATLRESSTLTERERLILVASTAAQRGDSYCSLAFGRRLARHVGSDVAAAVLNGEVPAVLDDRERALTRWARAVVADPNATAQSDVDGLRRAGLTDALGALPDRQLADSVPAPVRDAVTYGRAPAATPS
jgi:alkylhydroperoxidase family enzyme